MKKYNLLLFLFVIFTLHISAQSITAEEIQCIDALILAKTEPKKYKVDIDNYTLARSFEDTSLEKNNEKLITQLNELKTNDELRRKFYGILNYYYENYRNQLKQKLTLYTIKNHKYIDLSNKYPYEIFLDKIYQSTYREKKKDIIFYPKDSTSETRPEYPGGDAELLKFIRYHIVYPSFEKEADISGRVLLRFVIEKDGSISNIEVIKHVSSGIDCEAIKMIKMLSKWTPGYNYGQPVRSYFDLPINFTLK